MKKELKLLIVGFACFLTGVILTVIIQNFASPIDYVYDKEDKSIIFTTSEIVTDYETLERRFVDKDSYGTTFKVYFEKE